MRYLDAAAVARAVDLDELIDAVEAAYRDVAAGRDRSPLRSRIALSEGDLLLMPGSREGAAGVSVKIVSIVPRNAERGRATVQAVVIWIDALTGTPAALLDGEAVTALRTGAGTAAATRLLSRPESRVLAMIGAGGQAEWQVRATCRVRPIDEVRVWAPSARRYELVDRLQPLLAADVRAAESAEAAVRDADIVCCATTSQRPVFDAAWIRAGTHVNGIGAFRPGMVELPPELFGRADLVAVDSRAAAMTEAGDVLAAIQDGQIAAERVVEIGTLPHGVERAPGVITVFKSVGLAAQDAAAVERIVSADPRRASGAGAPGAD